MDHYDFYIPESDTIEIFAEITSAIGFEYDNIFIRYYVDISPGIYLKFKNMDFWGSYFLNVSCLFDI